MAAPRRSLALLLLPLLALLPACRAEPDSALYRRALAENRASKSSAAREASTIATGCGLV